MKSKKTLRIGLDGICAALCFIISIITSVSCQLELMRDDKRQSNWEFILVFGGCLYGAICITAFVFEHVQRTKYYRTPLLPVGAVYMTLLLMLHSLFTGNYFSMAHDWANSEDSALWRQNLILCVFSILLVGCLGAYGVGNAPRKFTTLTYMFLLTLGDAAHTQFLFNTTYDSRLAMMVLVPISIIAGAAISWMIEDKNRQWGQLFVFF